ncbi:MAG TPA: DUF4407 domain-containing protein, partial [Flavisolibacter sp.]
PIYQDAKIQLTSLANEIKNKEQYISSNEKIIASNKYRETRYRIRRDPDSQDILERIPYEVWLPNATARAKMKENKDLQSDVIKMEANREEYRIKQSDVEEILKIQADAVSAKYLPAKNSISQQIESLNNSYTQRKSEWVDVSKRSSDLPARLEALGNISIRGNSIWWASLVITLLFVVFETAPVVVKLLTKRGPYDEKLDALEYEVYIEESRKIDSLNRQVNEYMKLADEAAKLNGSLRLQAEKEKLDIELANNKQLLNKLAVYQSEIAILYADTWYKQEMAKAVQHATNMHEQSTAGISVDVNKRISGVFWRKIDPVDNIEYYFKNDSFTDNELLVFQNDILKRGKWKFNNDKTGVVINLLNDDFAYDISEINERSLKLKNIFTADILEFQKFN